MTINKNGITVLENNQEKQQKKATNKKAKRSLESLAEATSNITIEIEKSLCGVIMKDNNIAQITGIKVVELIANIEEIFNRIHHRKNGFRVKQMQIVDAMREMDICEDFITAFTKIKILRNSIVHRVSFVEPLYNYISRDLKGLGHSVKMKERMKLIVSTVHEEVHYATEAMAS